MEDQKTITRKEETLWIWDDNQMQMMRKTITFVPFLYQLFDKILLSAAHRKGVKDILVNINVADNRISVWAHGGCLDDINSSIIPEAQQYGLVSATSGDSMWCLRKSFHLIIVKVVKSIGADLEEVHITENWCFVSFIPHLPLCLEHDVAALMKRRVVDLAGTTSGLNVRLAGTRSLPRNFQDYVDLYILAIGGTLDFPPRFYEKLNDKWEICVVTDDLGFDLFDEVSFVNNIPMTEEGEWIMWDISNYLATIINLEPNDMKCYLWVFANAHIDNPDSQTQECELPPEFLKKIADSLKDLESLDDYWRD